MPGFMQSIKSHLPQSPFSPNKKGASATTPIAVTAPTVAVVEEQSSTSVLPGEALVQHNSSTVALTLTPANGESSQQLTVDDAEATPSASAEPITESQSPAESDSAAAENAQVEPTEAHTETVEAEAIQPIAEESTPAAAADVIQPEAAAAVCENDVLEPTPAPEAEAATAPAPTNVEVVDPQTEDVESQPAEQAVEQSTAPVDSEEPTVSSEAPNDVPPTPTEADTPKQAKAGKEFSTHVKRNKSKKSKSEAAESSEAGEPSASKPRKSHPLAGKFRSVIDQVRSKVKKDKEGPVTPPAVELVTPPAVEVVAPPAVQVIEPTPVAEEPVAAV